jgi:tRNA(His) guanylyltransferase
MDGVAFRTFTKGTKKPFDSRITHAMTETTKDLVHRFSAVSGYTQSDEISLVFPAAFGWEDKYNSESQKIKTKRTHPYGGRIVKISSVFASFASARFNYYLLKQNWTDMPESVQQQMNHHEACFDGRVIAFTEPDLLSACIFWRSNCDGLRNAISHISHSYYSSQELHGRSLSNQLRMLRDEKKVNVFQEFSPQVLYGTWVKKEQYELHNMTNPKTGELIPGPVLRTRLRIGSFNWADWAISDRADFIMTKYWKNDSPFPPKSPL